MTDLQQLVLVRHGQTFSNLSYALDTRAPGAPLTERGEAQAQALAAQWAHTGVDSLYRSHLLRTELTIRHLAEATGLPVTVREGLTEVSAGDLEMSTEPEALATYYGAFEAWLGGRLDGRLPGGESGAEILDRFDATVEEIVASGARNPLLVSHGAVIRLWAASRVAGLTPDRAFRNQLRNACAIVVRPSDTRHGWEFVSWQDMPPGEET